MAKKDKRPAFDFSDLTEEQRCYIAATAAVRHKRTKESSWRGMPAVPPGSLLEEIINQFQANTNIALEIPFTTFMHYIAGVLIGRKTQVDFDGRLMGLDFWTIVLAPSGAGKTWTEKEISEGFNGIDIPILKSGAASAARFAEELELMPQALWIRDEYFQLLKQLDTPGSPMSDMKDYLLRVYDNSDIERSTKKDHIHIKNPVLSILGFTALVPFVEGMQIENLLDGFAQRFAYVFARPDKDRPFQDFPVWKIDKTDWKDRFEKLLKSIQPVYKANSDAEKVFFKIFRNCLGNVKIEESFYRRVMWRAHKYALIYHIIRGSGDDETLTDEDYGWASRLIEMQLHDAADLIQMCSGTDITKAIDAAESVIMRLKDEGKPITARAVISGTRLIKNVAMARMVFQILGVSEGY